jgi:hypothetical protein
MISSYRLGDLVLLGLSIKEEDEILTDFPNSLASKYILESRASSNFDPINKITELVLKHIESEPNTFPDDISYSTVIHVRLGDVVGGNEWHEKIKRPMAIEHIKSILNDNDDRKYVIGRPFFAKTSSTNYDECIKLSSEYLQSVLDEFQATHFDSGIADIDLCCAIKSKLFVQGQGYFSKLIVEVRNKLNLKCI